MREEGDFRDDLYFRIAVITIAVPPLRSYLQNLDVLCQIFIVQANHAYGTKVGGLSADALARLRDHPFPGNVRELKNMLDHAVLVARDDRIHPEDLPIPSAPREPTPRRGARPTRPTLAELRKTWVAERERTYLLEVLEEVAGDVQAAARLLGVDRTTLYRLIKKRGLQLQKRVVRG